MRATTMRWVAVGLGLAVVIGFALIAVRDDGTDGGASTTTSTTMATSPLDAAVAAAGVEVDGVTDADVGSLIESLCSTQDADEVAAEIVALDVTDPDDVLALVQGVGDGASAYCPEVAAEDPGLVNEVYNATLLAIDEGADPG